MKQIATIIITVIISASFTGTANAQNIKTGEWSMTMVTKMEGMKEQMAEAMKAMDGMPAEQKAMMDQMMGSMGVSMDGEGMTVTTTQCITEEAPVPETEENKACKTTHTVKGNTVHFEAVCPQGASKGEVTYSGETMKGEIRSETPQGTATVKINGKYIGPCE